jgi:predicted Ser/Thr protein kinase
MNNTAYRIFSQAARHRYAFPAVFVGTAGLVSALVLTENDDFSDNSANTTVKNGTHQVCQDDHAATYQSATHGADNAAADMAVRVSLPAVPLLTALPTITTSCDFFAAKPRHSIRRRRTIKRLQETKTRERLENKYNVQWNRPLGEGGFGSVYLATDKKTGEMVAVKKISKQYTNDTSFQQEMNAFHQIRMNGNHPNICGLRENFDEGQYFYLVMDLISGGEVFDRLIEQGAYSEADAARLVREVGSALLFLHGIGIVHGDLVSSCTGEPDYSTFGSSQPQYTHIFHNQRRNQRISCAPLRIPVMQ